MNETEAAHSQVQEAMVDVLQQGKQLLECLTDEIYIRRVPCVFNGSIGSHYRHCLEHFEIILSGAVDGQIDYDGRSRSVLLETDRRKALKRTSELVSGIQMRLNARMPDRAVDVRCAVSAEQRRSPLVASSLAREAMYGVAHAVHHYALISVMAHALELELPGSFGMAPSTVAHRQSASVGKVVDEIVRS